MHKDVALNPTETNEASRMRHTRIGKGQGNTRQRDINEEKE